MRNRAFLILYFTLYSVTILRAQVVGSKSHVHVVLLAGQSNMVGAGNYDELEGSMKQRIKNISNRVRLSFNGKPAEPLSYYDNKPSEKYNFTKRFGPELLIGLTLAEKNPNQEYLLVKRAQGGTSLYGAWNPNWSYEQSKRVEKQEFKHHLKLYNIHIQDIKNNIKKLEVDGKTYEFIGLAWMQGESDTNHEVSSKSYKKNLQKLINHYRTDLDVRELPFVIGQINLLRKKSEEGIKLIREAMVKVAHSDYRNTIIKTSTNKSWQDYPKHSDNLHYNTVGQKRLGIAFGNAIIHLNHKEEDDVSKNKQDCND